MRYILSVIFVGLLATPALCQDDPTIPQNFNLHFQATYVYQYKPDFYAKYSGTNSLLSSEEKENSVTGTLYFGARLWQGAELYINPEVAGGSGLSGAFGLAASTNGETFRVGNPSPTLYLARAYLQQTFALSELGNATDDGANHLSGTETDKYLRLYVGKFSLGDLFDNNMYSNSPRSQFMNWALMNNAAWDYAANVRGYTYSAAAMLQIEKTSYKLALATLPTYANGPDLNSNLSEAFSVNAEISHSNEINERKGNIRGLLYFNSANMGSYQETINTSATNVTDTRKTGRTKIGFGISADQQIREVWGAFARIGWNDGKNETWCFTEADQTLSLGLCLNGKNWRRANDNIGFAVVMNGLSEDHKNYLTGGGMGFQLGDGLLNYSPETVLELYYSIKPIASSSMWFTADYQLVMNPGYNSDRGPANVLSVRMHVEL